MLPTTVYRPGSALRRWSGVGSDVNRLFEELWGGGPNGWTTWTPAADLYETGEDFVLEIGLPGFRHEDIEVTVERGILTVSGQRPAREEAESYTYHVREHTYDRFSRSFQLPSSVSADDVTAEFENGMLVVTLPKAAEAKPRRIAVSAK